MTFLLLALLGSNCRIEQIATILYGAYITTEEELPTAQVIVDLVHLHVKHMLSILFAKI